MKNAFMGIDVGSISTKGTIIDENDRILCGEYLYTKGDPLEAVKKLLRLLEARFDAENYRIVAIGTTGSARKLIGAVLNAAVIKNEITAHAVGTTNIHPDVRTIFEIGGQDSKIIILRNGVVTDYAMNTLCAAGTGAFISNQAARLDIRVEDFGGIALRSTDPTPIAARCTVFAESDLVHKLQIGCSKEDIAAGLCRAIVLNYLNNVAKGKKIEPPVVFQGGVSKNIGVVKAFENETGYPVIVDENGHLAGAWGAAILARRAGIIRPFDFRITDVELKITGKSCGRCANNCEVICVYREGALVDSWGNRCERGSVTA
ncbi:MAG: 2-hydroxyglutaryl-CoA dehydratase [Clostridia bacterium]|nr:2-hydroxyglutaryl-CoA dehydratase [Clostridia bacterium]MBR0509050.1 2-hydroxyglutaryl-CoA dehydratase [Clostridia bacterium]MBR0536570.1 2-hydroxyglutaryl-CoA dehydratase [Clostridia bacterium]